MQRSVHQEPTNREIYDLLQTFIGKTEEQFQILNAGNQEALITSKEAIVMSKEALENGKEALKNSKEALILGREALEASKEALEAVHELASHMDRQFDAQEQRIIQIEIRMITVVTKDYLDQKLSELRGDLVIVVRKEDRKLISLIRLLCGKKILSGRETQELLSMEPFLKK